MKNKILKYLGITIVFCLGVYLGGGIITRNPDKLIKQDSEYLYYKHYELYNNDSCVYKYHKPVVYDGIVTDMTSNFRGVPGKGGHKVYHTYIKYNDNEEYMETGWEFYTRHNKGDHVKVYIKYYPYKTITIK